MRSRFRENQFRDEDILTELEYSAMQSYWTEVDSNYTVSSGENVFVNTVSGSVVIVAYTTPSLGYEMEVVDNGGYCGTYSATISGTGQKIEGTYQNKYINTDYGSIKLIYGGTDSGWVTK